jgi:hypothetical protein
MITREQYENAVQTILAYNEQCKKDVEEIKNLPIPNFVKDNHNTLPYTKITDLDITPRLYNRLYHLIYPKSMHGCTLLDLCEYSIIDFQEIQGVGKRTIKEISEIMSLAGLRFKPNK